MVNNGGFENSINYLSSNGCGHIGYDVLVNCWEQYQPLQSVQISTADLLSNGCGNPFYNIGNSTYGIIPPINTLNLGTATNTQCIALRHQGAYVGAGVIKSNLTSSMVPTQTYQVSFWAINHQAAVPFGQTINSPNNPLVITLASSPNAIFTPTVGFPNGLYPLKSFTINAGNVWTHITNTFVFTPTVAAQTILFGINEQLTTQPTTVNPGAYRYVCFIDELSIMPVPGVSITLPTNSVCPGQSILNLTASTSGTFSGQGVSYGSQYDFNVTGTLSPGNYPIAFTYSNGSCLSTIYEMVTIIGNPNFVPSGTINLCVNNPTLNLNSLLTNTALTGVTYSIGGNQVSTPFTFTTVGQYTISASTASAALCAASPYTTLVKVNDPAPIFSSGTVTANSATICLGDTYNVTAASSSTNFVWQPGGSTNSFQSLTPTITTIYTVSAFDYSTCTASSTLAVFVATNCCSNTVTPFPLTSVGVNTSVVGPLAFVNSFTIQPNNTFYFAGGEFLMGANVKITVSSNAILDIRDSHLHACSQDMWQGIEVLDGGVVYSVHENIDNLIEDAIIAIDVKPVNALTNTLTNIVTAEATTFNKNYIDINITDYTKSVTPSPFFIYNCVFTCRDLSSAIAPTSWPQTATSNSANLRYVDVATTPTTGLDSPYLNQTSFSITTLKNPYSNQPSHIAINLATVGITSGPAATTNGTASMPGITIGDNSSASNFNLFDAHGSFIVAKKSNVTLANNVFQNTRNYTVTTGPNYSGTAVRHAAAYSTSDVMHTMLYMSTSNINTGNRFWNCHRGVELDKTYLFWIENAVFRSSQSTTNTTGYLPGNIGIYAPTNNFDYYIANNEFTNLKTAINIPITSGYVAPSPGFSLPPTFGIFGHRIRIDNNLFAAGSGGTVYMERAVDMTCPNSVPWQSSYFIVPSVSVTPFTQAFSITNNIFSDVFSGVSLNGSHGFQVDVSGNDISLKDNSAIQRGIALNNCLPTSAASIGKNIVSSNTLSFTSQPTFSQAALIYCGDNGYGISSPSVSCNDLTQSYQGFVFDGVNDHALWGGNSMSTPINRAFVLSHTAAIGAQGGTNTASANQWIGGAAAWTGNNYGTWVGANTNALASKLFVKSSSSLFPPNNSSDLANQEYGAANGIQTMSGGDYTCSEFPNYKVIGPNENDYESDITYYRAKSALYRFLYFNDSLRNDDNDLSDFFDEQSGTSIEQFLQIEIELYQAKVDEASDLIADLDPSSFNAIENSYKSFYTLYLAYLGLNPADLYSVDDSLALKSLAELCPGEYGPAIYQAISLYNTIYGEILIPDCSSEGGSERKAYSNEVDSQNSKIHQNWEFKIFPNPATDQLTITSSNENDILIVDIFDLSHRKILTQTLTIKNFISKLDINIINGAYFVTVRNSKNEVHTKKLLIAK